MRTLVTGGAGFIGSNLALRLARDGHDVVAADTFGEGRWRNLVEFVDAGGDVVTMTHPLDLDVVDKLGPFDAVFHQASVTGVIGADGKADTSPAGSAAILRNNIEGFRKVLDRCVTWGSTLVWASSCSIYGRGPVPMRESADPDPLNAYAFSKLAKERLAGRMAPKLAFAPVGLRYSNVYGPREDDKGPLASMVHQLAKQMRAGKRPRIFEAGQQRRDFVYVDDVVEASLQAEQASRDGTLDAGQVHVFNAGAGASWSFNDLVASLNEELGTDLPPDYFPNPFDFTQDHTETDITKAAEAFGYKPTHDLRSGVAAFAKTGHLGIAAGG
ncbi:MAG: NAD-dependent epimerase/dehydratase family protein [Planctomycetota bacterium]